MTLSENGLLVAVRLDTNDVGVINLETGQL